MDSYHKGLLVILGSTVISFMLGILVGWCEGKHEGRMSILRALNKINMTEISSTTRYHLIILKCKLLEALKKEERWGL